MGQAVSIEGSSARSNPDGPSRGLPDRRRVQTLAATWPAWGQLADGRLLTGLPGPVIVSVLQKLAEHDILHLIQVNRACAAEVLQHTKCTRLQLLADMDGIDPHGQLHTRYFAVRSLLQTRPRQLHVSMPRNVSKLFRGLPLTSITQLSIGGVQLNVLLLLRLQLHMAVNLQKLTVDSDICEAGAAALSNVPLSDWLPPSLAHCCVLCSPPMRLLRLLAPQLSKVAIIHAHIAETSEAQWQQLLGHNHLLASVTLDDSELTISYCTGTAMQVTQKLGSMVTWLRLQDVTITSDLARYTMTLFSQCPNIQVFSCRNVDVVRAAQTDLWQAGKQPTQIPATLSSLVFDRCHSEYLNHVGKLVSRQIKDVTLAQLVLAQLPFSVHQLLQTLRLTDHDVELQSITSLLMLSPLQAIHVHGVHIPDLASLTGFPARYIKSQSGRVDCWPETLQHLHVPVFGLRGHYNSEAIQLFADRVTQQGGLRLQPAVSISSDGCTTRRLPISTAELQQLLPCLPSSITLLWFVDIATAGNDYCYLNAAVMASTVHGLQLKLRIMVLTDGSPTLPTKQMVQLAKQQAKCVTLQWQQQQSRAGLPEEAEVSPSWLWQPPPAQPLSVWVLKAAQNTSDVATNTSSSSPLNIPAQTLAVQVRDASPSPTADSNADAAVSTSADAGGTVGRQ